MDPNTWFTSPNNGLPRMSSPNILRRDADTLNYLAHKQHIGGISLTLLKSIRKLPQQSYARRATILTLITGWNVDGSRFTLYTQDPQAKAINTRCPSAWPSTSISTGSVNAPVQQPKSLGTP